MTPLDEEPAYVTQKQLVRAGWVVGIMMAITVASIVVIAIVINNIQGDQIRHNNEINHKQTKLLKVQSKLIKDLRGITHPTRSQYRSQLKRGIKLCLREPSCRKLFPTLKAQTTNATGSHGSSVFANTNPTSGASNGSAGSDVTSHRGDSTPSNSAPKRPAPSKPPPRDSGPIAPPPSSPPPSNPPPAQPPATVSAATHLPDPLPNPQVCADGIVGINC
jgi:hypothetical protein